MSDKNRPQTGDDSGEEQHDGWSMRTKLILGGIGVIGFIILYLLAVYWVPGEWSRFITGITNRSTSTSWLLGLAIGFTFSLLPILVFLMGMRMRKSWRGIIGWLLVALVVALPNILTLGVRFGTRNAATAARTTLFTDAPGFTIASYVGMAVGTLTGLWVAWITVSRRSAQRKAARLAAKHREQELATAEDGTATTTDGGTGDGQPSDGSDQAPHADASHDGSDASSPTDEHPEDRADSYGDDHDPNESDNG